MEHCIGNGWINSELFFAFVQHFAKHAKASVDGPVLLLVNHQSHISLDAAKIIVMAGFPPHKLKRSMYPYMSHLRLTTAKSM